MNSRKILIYIALGMVSWLLVSSWQDFEKSKKISTESKGVITNSVTTDPKVNPKTLITLKAKDQAITIDRIGGKIVQTNLSDYALKKGHPERVHIFSKDANHPFYASVGYTGDADIEYQVVRSSKEQVTLQAVADQVVYTKTFSMQPDYQIKIETTVKNQGTKAWYGQGYTGLSGSHFYQLKKGEKTPEPSGFIAGEEAANKKSGLFGINTYTGAAYFTEESPYTKLTYQEMAEKGVNKRVKNSWIAIQKRYFLGAIVPEKDHTYDLVSEWKDGYIANNQYVEKFKIQLLSETQSLNKNEQASFTATVYSGPEVVKFLSPISPGLDKTIDYGFLWFISQAIFYLMDHVNILVHNWGATIILSTIIIRLLFFKLQESGNESMEKMKLLAPKMEAIQSQYADDPERKNAAILELYKKEKVNPIGGCLPMIIQIPFMFATYHVVMEAVQLRHQSFLWIKDLSATDPYYLLPLLLGAAVFAQTKMTPSSADAAQEKMKYILPVMLVFLAMSMPAGVSLYILASTGFGVLQQQLTIMRMQKKPRRV